MIATTRTEDSTMIQKLLCATALVAILISTTSPMLSRAADDSTSIRLYALDGGHIEIADMSMFSDTGEGEGKSSKLVSSAYLIRHPKGDLLWDSGFGDAIADQKDGLSPGPGYHISVPTKVVDQLQRAGVTPADIEFLAFSHMHGDHTGNANTFTGATWLVNQRELEFALSSPTPQGVQPPTFSAYKTVNKQFVNGDYDVFGDGKVRILKTPGHTPGHQVLVVNLAKAGTIVLSGDLYHSRLNAKSKLVPSFNASRADTLASFDRVDRILKNTHGRLIVQHAEEDFATLPKPPLFMQ